MPEKVSFERHETDEEATADAIFSLAKRLLREQPNQTPETALFTAMRDYGIPDGAVEQRAALMGKLVRRLREARPGIRAEVRRIRGISRRLAERAATDRRRPDVARQDDQFPPPGSEE